MDRSYPLFLFYFLWREPAISELFINEQIRDKEIRLIGESGEQLGIMSSREALKLAEEACIFCFGSGKDRPYGKAAGVQDRGLR